MESPLSAAFHDKAKKNTAGKSAPPAREVAQLGVESVHGSKSSQRVPHVPVGRDVVASQGRLTHLADNILP